MMEVSDFGFPDSASVGPIGPLLRQLNSRFRYEHDYYLRELSDSEAEGALDMTHELQDILVPVKFVYSAEDPSHTARWWMKEVRDLCHEIKDYCDESVKWDFTGFITRAQAVSQRTPSLHLTAGDFNRAARRDGTLRRPAAYMDDIVKRRLPVPAAPMDDPVRLLAFDDEKAKQLRVVTLFGFAGAVNTTAARTLYDLYGGRFQCRAFVRVSQDPDMKSIFTSILAQIKAPPADYGFSDVNSLIRSINNHLKHRRYLIVTDDLWTTPERNFIMGAFPGGYCHSRIITTTQTKDVALASCDSYLQNIFEMTPLNDDQSGRNPTPMEMKEELNCIFNKLAPELKTCLLYLNMYQPGYLIRKDDLVRQWIAERFLPTDGPENLLIKLAGDYFDELVSRELIQPVERDRNDEVISGTVEHMVLDMIAKKSEEVNFIATVNNLEKPRLPAKARRLSVQFRYEVNSKIPQNIELTKVRSLAFSGFYECVPSLLECSLLQVLILHIWADQDKTILDLSIISGLDLLRYVKITCNVTVRLPYSFSGMQFLETLQVDAIIQNVPSYIPFPTRLFHLSLPDVNLPNCYSMMANLCTLGCFDLGRNSAQDVNGLFNLINLEDLHLTCSAANEANMQEKIDVIWGLIFSRYSTLRSVDLLPTGSNDVDTAFLNVEETEDSGDDGSASPLHGGHELENLELSPRICIFSSIPKRFIKLKELRILKIAVRTISDEDIDVLRIMHKLTALSLYVWSTFGADKVEPAQNSNKKKVPRRIEFCKHVYEFPVLTYFKFTCPAPCLTFLKGAMPRVRRLKLRFNDSTIRKYSLGRAGLENLTNLQEISVKIGTVGDSEFGRRAAKSELGSAFPDHSVRPVVNLQSVDRVFGAHQPEGADSRYVMSLSFSSFSNKNSLSNRTL